MNEVHIPCLFGCQGPAFLVGPSNNLFHCFCIECHHISVSCSTKKLALMSWLKWRENERPTAPVIVLNEVRL